MANTSIQIGKGASLELVMTVITEIMRYNIKTPNRLPSRTIRMNSFFIRNLRRDSDPRSSVANWNKLSLEQYMKRSKDPKTYKVAPKTASTGGSLPYKTFRNISAINVDG